MTIRLLGMACAWVVFSSASAQQPPRDSAAPQTGTASIAGRVVLDDDGRPINRAAVALTGAALGPGLLAMTDQDGRFEFPNLPAGDFTATASKASYLTTSYGQRVPGRGTGVPISVGTGERVTDVTIRSSRGAVIAGTLRDSQGRPIAHAPITVLEFRMVDGQRTLWSLGARWPPTDSEGGYRAYGLRPGSYFVSAYPPGAYRWFPGATEGRFEAAGATWGARGDPVRAVSPAEIQWALRELERPDLGMTGRGVPPAGTAIGAAVPPFAATFYPGTADPASATAVVVGRGEERSGIDFAMVRQSTARVAGRAVMPDGLPAVNVTVSLNTAMTASGSVRADGRFSWEALAPGRYTIIARAASGTMWAKHELMVTGEDLVDLVLALAPAVTLTGRVRFDGSKLAPPTDMSSVSLALRQDGLLTLVPVDVRPDGTFDVETMPGEYFVIQPGGNHAWAVASVLADGRDLTDRPLRIAGDVPISGLVVTFTDRLAELRGTLLDANGQPASGYYVVLFSTSAEHWTGSARRKPALVRTSTNGTYAVAGLRTGAYHIVAVADIDEQDLDAVLLSRLAADSITLTLQAGESRVQDLRFTAGN